MSSISDFFHRFPEELQETSLPDRFTFPFYYEPHPLAVTAAREVQEKMLTVVDYNHNFGLDDSREELVIGKMFGVLVVQHQNGDLGYLTAFSGKLGNSNHHQGFVPPIFDMLEKNGHFKREEDQLNDLNHKIETLEQSPAYLKAKDDLASLTQSLDSEIATLKSEQKERKRKRKVLRKEAKLTYTAAAYDELHANCAKESLADKRTMDALVNQHQQSLVPLQSVVSTYEKQIQDLKLQRKLQSNTLQQWLFKQYNFLNIKGDLKDVRTIFQDFSNLPPPAGAGECAAPKLLQFAFQHQLRPVTMAEFWWGASPKSEVRKHKQFYPACRGKCEPILDHMLSAMEVDENPMLKENADQRRLEIVYEDDHLLAIHKPPEMLSVPGKNIEDSVYFRLRLLYPKATGPLLVHRLDMSTSGVMLIAKNKDIHKSLQRQFINRTVRKQYVALLDGVPKSKPEGTINLPLRVDLDNRPCQLVCYEHGKTAVTKYKILSSDGFTTRISFQPITGRTHQLRVHAAHHSGLNTPIKGDDLYGLRSKRLYLHAEKLTFKHPISQHEMTIHIKPEF